MRQLYKDYKHKGISFYLGHRTPRKNDFEDRMKYFLIYGYTNETELNNTGFCFSSIAEAKRWIKTFYFTFI